MKLQFPLLTAALLAVAPLAFGQTTASASAAIYVPITVAKTQDLDFGAVFSGTQAGTIAVDASTSAVTVGPGGTDVTYNGTLHAARRATFSVTGKRGATFAITLPSTTVTMTNQSGGGATIGVDTFYATNAAGTPVAGPSVASSIPTGGTGPGSLSFGVGATMHVQANQADGDYTTIGGQSVNVTVTCT